MADYVKVAQVNEIEPNHGKLVEVRGKKIALFDVDGKFYATRKSEDWQIDALPQRRSTAV